MQKIIVAIANAATTIASRLARPSKRVYSEGRPKMPLPMTALIKSAVNLHLPVERMKGIGTLHDNWHSLTAKPI
jgi:hypothetical protein